MQGALWYSFLIGSLMLLAVFSIDEQFVPAFAIAPSPPDITTNNAVDAAGLPRAFYRGISETLSVASAFGSPGAPNHYTRTVSESLTITSTFPGQAQTASSAAGPALRITQYSPVMNQRGDERANLSFKTLKKGGLVDRNAVAATPFLNLEALAALSNAGGGPDGDLEGAGVDSEPDDDDGNRQPAVIIQRYLAAQQSMQNAAAVGAGTYGTLLIGALALAVARSPVASRGRCRVCAVVIRGAALDRAGLRRPLLVVLVVLAAGSIALAAEPSAGQAFADEVAGIAYKTGSAGGVAYRQWDPSTTSWGSQVSLTSAGSDIYAVKFLYSPVSQLKVIGVLESNGEIDIYYCEFNCVSASSWTGPVLVADMGTPTAGSKYFDMAFESSSGELLIVYDKAVTEAADFYYKTLDPSTLTLSGEGSFNYVGGATADNRDIRFFRMASKARSDEIAMILLDAGPTTTSTNAFIWNGSSFGNSLIVSSNVAAATTRESIGVAYETSSGAAMVFSADNTGGANAKAAFARFSGGSWGPVTRYDPNPSVSNTLLPLWFAVKANPVSNQIMACNLQITTNDLSCILVTAGVAGTNTRVDPEIASAATRMFDIAWDPAGSTGIVVYDDAAATTSIKFRTFDASGALSWGAETSITVAVQVRWLVGATDTGGVTTGVDSLWAWYEDTTTDDIGDGEWDRTSTTATMTDNGDASITADAGTVNTVEVMAIDFRKSPGKRSISDSFTIGDSVTYGVTRSIAETLPVSDAIVAKVTGRAIADGLSVTDSITAKITARAVADSLGVTDVIAAKITGVAISDSIAVTDNLTGKVTARAIADSFAVTDAIAKSVTKQVSDSVGITDTISHRVNRSVTDNLGMTDAISTSVSRSISDSLGVTDGIITGISRSISESIAVTDTIAKSVTKQVADSVAVTEVVAAKVTGRAIGDSVTVVDSVATNLSRPVSENISVSETVDRVYLALRSAADSIGVTESITMSVSRPMVDTIGITDLAAITMVASRPASETLSVIDSVSAIRTVQSAASDTVGVTDVISVARGVSGSPSDSLSVTDSITKSVTRSTDDSITFTDSLSVNITVSRPMSDSIAISDSMATGVLRPVSETIPVTDSVTGAFIAGRTPSDTLAVDVSVSRTYAAVRALQDTITLTDGISVNITRSEADTLGVSDSIETAFGKQREMSNSIALTDGISIHVKKSATDAVNVSDDVAKSMAASRSPSESITVTDGIETHRAYSATISDTVAMTDTPSMTRSVSISDTVAITPDVQIKTPSLNFGDSLAVSDTISGSVAKERAIADGFIIVDVVARGNLVTINDSVTVASALTDVSWARTLNLTEQMTISGNACTPAECAFNLHLGESLALGDGFAVLRAQLADTVSVTDEIAAGRPFDRQPSDALTAVDKVDYLAKFTPPAGTILGPMVTTNPATVAPPSATAVAGTFSMSGGASQLASDLGISSADATALLTPQTTLVLPMYKVPLTWTEQLPTTNTLMTVKVTSIPAGTPVMVPVNMASTPDIPQGSQVPWMKVEYTPQVDSSDFALVVTPLESQPAGAPAPQADLTPLYIDVRWVGTFAGGTSPASSSYYTTPPTFTFALTDAWANANNVQRDSNGVPMITLDLLNEVTSTWETIGADKIDEPTGLTDGQYVYVAHLEHFSTYVVTANTSPTGGKGRVLSPATFAVDLFDSLQIREAQDTLPVQVIEEFVGEAFSVAIADRLGISVKPVAFQTFKVSENVNVSIGIDEITSEGILSQIAKANFIVQVANRGANHETFQLNFSYYDQAGKRAYESSQEIKIAPFEAKEYTIEVPFSSAGTFTVVAEAKSVPEGDLLNAAQFTVDIPWLSIYFHLLVSVAAAIIGASVVAAILLMRTNRDRRDHMQSQP